MDTIEDEYHKLSGMFETTEGRQIIDNLWFCATNHEKREGHWYKKSYGMGDKVSGLAIDLHRGKHLITPPGYDHDSAYFELISEIVSTVHDCEFVVHKGWLSQIDGWTHPFIFMSVGLLVTGTDTQLEEYILKHRLGLPLNSLYKRSLGT